MFCAIAAGVTIRAKISSAPTACTDSATVTATRTRKSAVNPRAWTPRVTATSGSMLRNSSGRATTRRATHVAIPVTEPMITCADCRPRMEPNSTVTPTVPEAALRDAV